MKRTTPKQEAFALEYVLNGCNATKAYETVYDVSPTSKRNTIYKEAFEVLENPKVSPLVHKLRMQAFSKHIVTVEDRKKVLSSMILEQNLKAMDILNKMEGEYIEKVEVKAEVKSVVYDNLGNYYEALKKKNSE